MNEDTRPRRPHDLVWTPVLGILLFASLLVPRSEDPRELRVKRLTIVNDEGDAVVEIHGDERGGALSLRSTEGTELVSMRIAQLGGELQLNQAGGLPAILLNTGPITHGKVGGTVDVFDFEGKTAVVLSSGDESGQAVSMGASVRGGVLGLFRDGKQHLLDPLGLDRINAAHPGDRR